MSSERVYLQEYDVTNIMWVFLSTSLVERITTFFYNHAIYCNIWYFSGSILYGCDLTTYYQHFRRPITILLVKI